MGPRERGMDPDLMSYLMDTCLDRISLIMSPAVFIAVYFPLFTTGENSGSQANKGYCLRAFYGLLNYTVNIICLEHRVCCAKRDCNILLDPHDILAELILTVEKEDPLCFVIRFLAALAVEGAEVDESYLFVSSDHSHVVLGELRADNAGCVESVRESPVPVFI